MPLHLALCLAKTTLLLLFVTSSQAQISAFYCTSQLNESPSSSGFLNTNMACSRQSRQKKREKKRKIFFFFLGPQNRGASYTPEIYSIYPHLYTKTHLLHQAAQSPLHQSCA